MILQKAMWEPLGFRAEKKDLPVKEREEGEGKKRKGEEGGRWERTEQMEIQLVCPKCGPVLIISSLDPALLSSWPHARKLPASGTGIWQHHRHSQMYQLFTLKQNVHSVP